MAEDNWYAENFSSAKRYSDDWKRVREWVDKHAHLLDYNIGKGKKIRRLYSGVFLEEE